MNKPDEPEHNPRITAALINAAGAILAAHGLEDESPTLRVAEHFLLSHFEAHGVSVSDDEEQESVDDFEIEGRRIAEGSGNDE